MTNSVILQLTKFGKAGTIHAVAAVANIFLLIGSRTERFLRNSSHATEGPYEARLPDLPVSVFGHDIPVIAAESRSSAQSKREGSAPHQYVPG